MKKQSRRIKQVVEEPRHPQQALRALAQRANRRLPNWALEQALSQKNISPMKTVIVMAAPRHRR